MRLPLMLSVAALALTLPALGLAQRAMPEPVKVDPAVAKARDDARDNDKTAWAIVEDLTTEVGQRLAAT
ncbi:MAG TPA: peptidase M28 family protein, partial [Sphingomonas sp.]